VVDSVEDKVIDKPVPVSVWFVRAGWADSPVELPLEDNVIAVGWDALPDLRTVENYEALRGLYASTYSEESPSSVGKHTWELHEFLWNMEAGDYVLLRQRSSPDRVDVGQIVGQYEYVGSIPHHRRQVEWVARDLSWDSFSHDFHGILRISMTVHRVDVPDASSRVEAAIATGTDPGPPLEEVTPYSWTKPSGIPNLIGRKKVDWSVFQEGTVIPRDFHAAFEAANEGEHLQQGQHQDLELLVEGRPYEARLDSNKLPDTQANSLEIRYGANTDLKQLLRERLIRSYQYVVDEREKRKIAGNQAHVVVPDEDAEYLDFLVTGVPYHYEVRMVPQPDDEEPGPGGPTIEELAQYLNAEVGDLRELQDVLLVKPQIVFEGPPGAGKTYMAEAFARYFTGNPIDGSHDDHLVLVQFHQSYGYEDFIQGIRPETGAEGQLRYELRDGIFKALCRRAREEPEGTFVILIDEINRGNISRIFGELLLLMEYRDKEIKLPYARPEDPPFSIPPNVYLIGTMNTADRSLAQIDYALRRRFYFWELTPVVDGRAPYLDRWLKKQQNLSTEERQDILRLFLALNEQVAQELGPDFLIGHSYFMAPDAGTTPGRERIWRRAIIPLLREYFHNRQDREQLLDRFSMAQLTKHVDGLSEDEPGT
jgi:MoxR-like ATPase